MKTTKLSVAIAMVAAVSVGAAAPAPSKLDVARLSDNSDGKDWAAYGRTFGEQHYSPLTQINDNNIEKLGLAWSLDLANGNSVTQPLAVDGVLYFATSYSLVQAVDAVTGKRLWTYDPHAAAQAGIRLREGWGSRGIGYWNGKIYTGTQDGRLIAIDAKTGKPVWSTMTLMEGDGRFISGAPRLFDGKVIIGHGGADSNDIRGYVTAYDAETGKQLWRFFTVPGNPANGFESKAMEMAAKTWFGPWWEYGGGGTVWNAITYDAGTDTIFLGTGNGAPWNRRIRSEGKGDNLFLCSIVALDGKTGAYKWHYQINPGESWDYNASMDMELADLTIAGQSRKVLMTAPKNGFFYVIDRITGKLISAEPIANVSWASKIDIATGRPVENPDARYPDGKDFILRPASTGAHNWYPMSYSPKAGLVFIPSMNSAASYNDRGITRENWRRAPGNAVDAAANVDFFVKDSNPDNGKSALLAWNPVTQTTAWRMPTPGPQGGGVMATAGNLVFQGQLDSTFNAYEAATGKRLWFFKTQAPMQAAPITYLAGGHQYVTILSGIGTSTSAFGAALVQFHIDARSQERRVLTFMIGGKMTLPKPSMAMPPFAADPDYKVDPKLAGAGMENFGRRCSQCHGASAIAGGQAPDLRRSGVPASAETFNTIVHDGALVSQGMPQFSELSTGDLAAIRQYIRSQAAVARTAQDTTAP